MRYFEGEEGSMWIILSAIAAVTSALSVILQKSGSENHGAIHVGALCNAAAFVTMLLAVLISGSLCHLPEISSASWMLSLLSGFVQAFSWITFFIAIKDADINAMMALDKLNIVAAMILAWFLLGEPITLIMLLGTALILVGSCWMANIHLRGLLSSRSANRWVFSAVISPILMAVSNVIAKLDISPVSTDLNSAIRMFVVAVVVGILALFERHDPIAAKNSRKSMLSLALSGVLLGVSYLLMYRALVLGSAAAVTTIVKGSIIVTTILARIFYGEKLQPKGLLGLIMVLFGIICFAF